jgi:hypothetical protein
MKYSLKFILRHDLINKSGKCPVYLRYTYNRKIKNLPLKYTIEPKYWDDETSTVSRKYDNLNGLKKIMGDFEGRVIDLVQDYHSNNEGYPTIEELKVLLSSGVKKGNTKSEPITLSSLYEGFIQYKRSVYIEESTINIYKQTWEKWTIFEKESRRVRVLSEMNEKSLTDFKVFLMAQGLQKNTIGKFIKTIKSFLNYVTLHLEMEVPPSFKRVAVDRDDKKDFQVLSRTELEEIKREVFFSRYFKKKQV